MSEIELYNLWCKNADEDPDLQAELAGIANDEAAIKDRFYRDLEFGTGGLRGIMGPGTNRMNKYVVGMATQGFANYINKAFPNITPAVVVGHDCRNNGRMFAETVANIFSANGIKVYLFESLRPTPEISFAIRQLGAQAGVNVTASHNPKEYNGYKVYGPNGGQILEEDAKAIQNEIESVKEIKFSDAYELASSDIYDSYRKEMESASNFNLGTSDDVILSEAKNLKFINYFFVLIFHFHIFAMSLRIAMTNIY